MSMTAGLDCGPVFLAEAIDIGADETAGELHDRLAAIGGRLLVDNLEAILAKQIEAVAQDDSRATYAGKVTTADAVMDWAQSADEICRKVRAYNPAPGAWFMLDNERVKCWRASPANEKAAASGTVLSADRNGVVVASCDGAVAMLELQRPGKGRVSAQEFAAQTNIRGRILA